MKLHKLISRTVLATALLGTTIGGAFAGINASASDSNINNTSTANNPVANNNNNNETGLYRSGFQINSNTLTLDSVPALNFGASSNSSPNQSGNNILPLNNDNSSGDNSRLLEVTDYRKGSSSSTNQWELQASMDNLSEDNGNNNKQIINNEWKLDLFNHSQNLDGSTSPYTPNDTTLTFNNNSGGSDGYHQVMYSDGSTSNSNTKGYGVNQIRYNNGNDAKLTIPNVAPGKYSANINWQLSTSVSEQDN